MWVRGLKFIPSVNSCIWDIVAPHVGAWIEISERDPLPESCKVAPHVGAWIEIITIGDKIYKTSLVAPHVGAWIEMCRCNRIAAPCGSRTPCGCVD